MKIFKDSIIYIFGEVLAKVAPFLLIPYLSRKLGVSGYGELSYYQVYLSIIVLIVGMSQDGVIGQYFYSQEEKDIQYIINHGAIYSGIVTIFLLVLCFFCNFKITFFIALSALFILLTSVQLTVFQCKKKSIAYTVTQFLLTLFSVIATVFLFEIFDDNLVEKRFLALSISHFFVFLLVCFLFKGGFYNIGYVNFSRIKKDIFYIIYMGFPLVLHHGFNIIKGQMDRFFIYYRFDEGDLGLYAMGANLATIFFVLIMAVNRAISPYYYESLKNKKLNILKIRKMLFFSIIISPLPSVFIFFLPESFFLTLLASDFFGVKFYFMLFSLSNMLMIPYLILSNYLFYFRENKKIAFCSFFSTVLYFFIIFLLSFIDVSYIPFASVLIGFFILPILWNMVKNIDKKNSYMI